MICQKKRTFFGSNISEIFLGYFWSSASLKRGVCSNCLLLLKHEFELSTETDFRPLDLKIYKIIFRYFKMWFIRLVQLPPRVNRINFARSNLHTLLVFLHCWVLARFNFENRFNFLKNRGSENWGLKEILGLRK